MAVPRIPDAHPWMKDPHDFTSGGLFPGSAGVLESRTVTADEPQAVGLGGWSGQACGNHRHHHRRRRR